MPKFSRLEKLKNIKFAEKRGTGFISQFSPEDRAEWDAIMDAIRADEIDTSNKLLLAKELKVLFNISRSPKAILEAMRKQLNESS